MSLLITPTVLNSLDWLKKCPPSWKKKAHTDLLNTLSRIWVPPKEAVQRGIDFEKYVCKAANQDGIQGKGSSLFQEVVNEIRGGEFQYKSKFFVEVDGEEYCCYSKIDVWFEDLIIDIKTTGSYKGKESYLSGWQHKFYTTSTRIPNFRYLIVQFDGANNKILDIYRVEYENPYPPSVKIEIIDHIKVFTTFLDNNPVMKTAYLEKFNLYN